MVDPEKVARGERLRDARRRTAVLLQSSVSQERMAELVSAKVGRSIGQTMWSNYETGVSDPPYDVIVATSAISGLAKGYLAFGVDSTEYNPGNIIDPSRDRKLTEEELDRAEAISDARRAERERAQGGKRRPA